jgi:hypothetical protein
MLDMSTNKAVFFLSSLPGRQYKGVEPYWVTVRHIKL